MAVSAAALRELHRIHRQLSDLGDRLERGPRQVRAREANLAKLEQSSQEAHDNLQQTKLTADNKQLDLKSGELKIEDLKGKLNACSSNKEYQALLEQIAAAEMAGSVLADEILETMEKSDQLELEVERDRQLLDTSRGEFEKFKETVAQELEVVRGDIERLTGELREAEHGLTDGFKVDYQRVIRGKGAEGMAEVEDGVCLGCGQQITLNMQNDLLLSKPIFCRSCGCLLYMGEN